MHMSNACAHASVKSNTIVLFQDIRDQILAYLTAHQSRAQGYTMHHRILDTQHHGLPQSRRRIYIVGIKSSVQAHKFTFPPVIKRVSLDKILKPRSRPEKTWKAKRPNSTCKSHTTATLYLQPNRRLSQNILVAGSHQTFLLSGLECCD